MREAPRLAEMRLQALEARIEADLHLGRAADVVAELQRLTGAHPLREHLHAQLMLAFYRTSRQCEALAAYQNARRLLIEELGTEPGIELRELHQRILTGDAGLTAPAASPSPAGSPALVPRELPAPVPHFAGRAAELAALTRLLDLAGEGMPGTVVISAIGGTAGVGKTALAVHWAHQVAASFPGWAAVREPARVRSVRRADDTRAGDMQVPGRARSASRRRSQRIWTPRPAGTAALLAGRRMLIVLDNARDAEQVRPLLPASAGHAWPLVTSRSRLTGLVAVGGAHAC